MFGSTHFGCFPPRDNDDSFTIKIEGSTFGNEYHKFTKDGHTYYALPHNSSYKVRMTNNTDRRANATLKIDGENMGTWRLDAYSDVTVERPSHNNRKFTFVRETSWQAKMGGVAKGVSENGLVEVTFIPEIKSSFFDDSDSIMFDAAPRFNSGRAFGRSFAESDMMSNGLSGLRQQSYSSTNQMNESLSFNSMNRASANSSYAVGGTVLGGNSSQRFSTASHITEDHSRKQTKCVRLVVTQNDQPFVSIRTRGPVFIEPEIYDDPVPPQLGRAPRRSRFVYNESESEYARPRSDFGPIAPPRYHHDESFTNHRNRNRSDDFDSYYS